MIKGPELLAPAGGMQQLVAAVENGADAVYIGGQLFNARENATNFSDEEIVEAIQYAHVRDVKIYITMNTLLNDQELPQAVEYAKKMYLLGADALIIQDIGFGEIIKEELPDFPLHASTQATVYSLEGVLEYAKLGYKRVILARELNQEEIDYISKNSPIEVETFVHGALCMSYSGQCLLSSFNGGRSGNRGRCAQPCRLPFEVVEKNRDNYKRIKEQGYYLSPKDLKLVEHLPELVGSKVASIKIEGRMKSPEYTAIVTKIYRKYLDLALENKSGNVELKDAKDLIQIFNRGGFSTGYFEEKLSKRLITKDRPKHWGALVGTVRAYESKKDTIKIKLKEDLHIGDGIEIVNDQLPGNVISFMVKNGERVTSANRNDTVIVGDIRGTVKDGDLVYRITKKSLMSEAQQTYKSSQKKSFIQMNFEATLNKKPVLTRCV